MIKCIKHILIIFSFLFTATLFSQKVKNDTIKANELEEVVITGQYSRQSVKKSVFEVTVIDAKTIKQNAANNLADLLNQTLNVSIRPNTSTGKSEISLFGFGSEYVKVLIDNVPVINEDGVGNNIDLTLINLDDVKQIEIVEGAMGVQYGSNAVAGIINIITKKSSRYKMKITTSLQEETVGKEYEWFAKGKHIQSLKLGYNFNDNLFGSLAVSRNDFGGFWNGRQGKDHDIDDDLRGHDWLPKKNTDTKLLLNYKKGKFNIFYKFNYLDETIELYNQNVSLNHIVQTDTDNPTALDKIYNNKRFIHNLSLNGVYSKNKSYDFSISQQTQRKGLNAYTYRIREDEKENEENREYKSRSVIISRGTLSNILESDSFKLQAGYEVSLEKGVGTELSLFAGVVDEQKLNIYNVFASSEYIFNNRFSVRPGIRVSSSNVFKNQYVYSLSSKYIFDKNIELRLVAGSANRTPNYGELFEYFTHPSHDIFGNINLIPENGFSVFTHLKKKTWFNKTKMTNKLSIGYIDLRDKIDLLLVTHDPRDTYSFANIDNHKTLNFSLENSLQYKALKANLGLTFLGIAQYFDESNSDQGKYLFSPNLNASVFYNARNINASFALTYKYNGKSEEYVFTETDINGNDIYSKGITDSYSWLDATIKKSFLDSKIETTLGIRNLLNVTRVSTTAYSGGGHSNEAKFYNMAYGRSYFLKLAYNIKQN